MWRPARHRPPAEIKPHNFRVFINILTEDGDRPGQEGGPGHHGELHHLAGPVGDLAADGPPGPSPGGEVLAVVADHIVRGVGQAALPVSHRQGSLHHYSRWKVLMSIILISTTARKRGS